MKKKQSISELKKEGLVTTADKLVFAKTDKKSYDGVKLPNNYLADEFGQIAKSEPLMIHVERLIWLNDFLKRKKKRFEDFSIEVEEMYSGNPKKPKKSIANDLGDRTFEKGNHSNFKNDLRKQKCGF